jgi:hypothetical protein
MREKDPILSASEARRENREEHEKFDLRLRRLEIAVVALSLIALGNGAGSILSKVIGG